MTSGRVIAEPRGGRAERSVQDRLRAHAYRHAVPLKVHLELTQRCNLRCRHCYSSGEHSEELSTARWLRLVDELAEAGCLGVALTGGEIGLRPDFLDIARRAKESRMLVTLLTNATLFDEAAIEAIVALRPAKVNVSIYGATAAAHDRITRVRGSFRRSVASIRALRGGGVRCEVHSVLMKLNAGEIPGIAALADELGCRYVFDPTVAPRDDGDAGVLGLRVQGDALRDFYLQDVLRWKSREFEAAADPERRRSVIANCAAGIASAFVTADGQVLPCMGFGPGFGSVVQRPFAAVWQGKTAGEHRRLMALPPEGCDGCSLMRFCTTRCPRLAAVEDGNPFGKSRRACELAGIVKEMRKALS